MYRTPIALACLVLSVAATGSAQVSRRTVNDGNVVLEGVPELPERIAEALNRYQNTRGASFQDWAPDGRGLYITTRFGEVSQIHFVAEPGGARRQMTFFEEPVGGADRRPGGRDLAYLRDEGGGEFYQIFLLDPATGASRLLTDGSSRNGSAEWSDDGRWLAYLSTRRNGRSNDIWLMSPEEPAAARLILEAPDGAWWSPADWSADGRWLLAQQYVSVTDSRIHLLDLETGESRPLAGSAEAPSVNLSPRFDAGGTGVFFLTDAEGDFRQLAYLDLTSGQRQVVTRDLAWDVGSLSLSDDRRRGAFDVNEGGVESLHLLDPVSRSYRKVEGLPVGLVSAPTFSPDGRRLAMTLNTSNSPSDVYTLELGEEPLSAGDLTRWTFSEVGGLDTEAFVSPELIHYPTYDTVDGAPRQIPAFVYRPGGDGPHPVIVSIHGGPEGQFRPSFRSTYQMWIAQLGAAVIAPNVRGSSGYGKEYVKLDNGLRREDSVKDIGALLDWIATQPDLDPERVAVYGGSYGGYMVLASLMHYSPRLACGVDIVGISNFVTFLENTQDYRRDLRRVEYGDERDPELRRHLQAISPGNHPEKITSPLFVAQGQNDPRVPVTESEQMVAAMRSAGNQVWYMNALNEGHGFRKKENRDLFEQIVVMFLEECLTESGHG